MWFDHELLTMVYRIALTALLAGFIGWEREVRDQPAGLRTHLLVAVGSCLMMLLSIYGFSSYTEQYANIDLSRIPAYVISGLGFLGAGTIIVHKNNVKGLTTAASIWVVAGIGLIVGVGMYALGIIATIIVFFSLTILKKIEKRFIDKD